MFHQKKRSLWAVLIGGVILSAGCSSAPKVVRVDADTQIDLTGNWNDQDVKIVCDSLINDCLKAGRVAQFIKQYSAEHEGRRPSAIVGRFRNDSSEHIDTSVIAKSLEIAIVQDGRLDFVAGGETRDELREERQDQQAQASEETASALGKETGAVFLLTGAVKSIVDKAGDTTVRSYFVSAELTSIETNTRLWMGQNSEIKKVIKQPKYKL
ncbi:MAG: penicillin-binding protein activator LpoB [Spirochaetaceae bacterium]|jgi:PBP1b-binding outer membrane lipoprotein LpoB|nr:penicillin-binding protein activator LpoB [Spirochaetaceae bacterium]